MGFCIIMHGDRGISKYEKIIHENLEKIYNKLPAELERAIPATKEGGLFCFKAFGEECIVGPDEVLLSGRAERGPKGLLVSLYVLHASLAPIQLEPFKSFRDFPGSVPYQGAFIAHSERILLPYVSRLKEAQGVVKKVLGNDNRPEGAQGDFSFFLYPLPKIAMYYIFYLPDEEFPASVTCLFSSNAMVFMPLDGLADVAEYTSKRIIDLIA
ncbi:MAG: DUF3786 domain-containing protein [Pseudomonadota bacterium]